MDGWVSLEMGATASTQREIIWEVLFYRRPSGRCSPGSDVTAGSHKSDLLYPEVDNMYDRTGLSD